MTKAQKTFETAAHELMRAHFGIEKGLTQIAWFPDPNKREIRLIEVNKSTWRTGKVMAFYLSPDKDHPYPVKLADVTPEEWEEIERGVIPIPSGWELKAREIFKRRQMSSKKRVGGRTVSRGGKRVEPKD